jgi:hypothetical protein
MQTDFFPQRLDPRDDDLLIGFGLRRAFPTAVIWTLEN